jgi:hypothetical protein
LRETIANAATGDTVEFDSAVTGTVRLTSGPLNIDEALEIEGPGANNLTVTADFASEVIYVSSAGTVTIAGLAIADGSTAGPGGILNDHSGLTVTDSTPSDNSGGTYGAGGIDNAGTLTVTDSTLAGNSAAILGGGIDNAGTLTVADSTLAGNNALAGGGIYRFEDALPPTVADTIFANNTAPTGSDVYGAVTSLGFNLIGNPSGRSGFVAADLLNVDPLLGPLQDNGGPTETMALLPGTRHRGAWSRTPHRAAGPRPRSLAAATPPPSTPRARPASPFRPTRSSAATA